MKISFAEKTAVLTILAALFISNPIFSAKKKKDAVSADATEISSQTQPEVSLSESIKLPTRKNKSYFKKIDESVLKGIEIGSPSSIKSAISKLRQKSEEYQENEKVLVNIAANIMKYAWPSEPVMFDVPSVDDNNPYMGAIGSVKQGVFDYSTGNADFFAIMLPALVLLNPSASNVVYGPCEDVLKTSLLLRPDSVLVNYLSGILYEKKGELKTAEKYLSEAYKDSESTQEIALAYGRVLRLNGNVSLASQVINKLGSDSDNIEILKQNAYIAFASGNYDSAEIYVARVLQQTPNDLEFLLFRAKILIEKNDYIHAVSLLDMYARQDSSSIDYLILRVRVQLDWSKNTTAATDTVEKALKLYPDNQEALIFAARISAETDSPVAGKYADELAALVLNKDPDNQVALGYALKGLIQRENWQEAYNTSRKLIFSENVSPEIVEQYVTVCIKLGKKNEGYEFAKAQYDAHPDDEIIMQTYLFAYSQVGSRENVLKYIDSLLVNASSKTKSYIYYRRSFLHYTEEKKLEDLRLSLISNPRNSDALFSLYELYYEKKDYRKAQYYLRQVVAIKPNDNSVKKLNEALTKLIK